MNLRWDGPRLQRFKQVEADNQESVLMPQLKIVLTSLPNAPSSVRVVTHFAFSSSKMPLTVSDRSYIS